MLDSLTGCCTRACILTKLEELVGHKQLFTLFVIDLNKFKNINDLQGHVVGDVVLQEVGHRLQNLSYESLLVARIGGDEFLAVLLGNEREKIRETARQISSVIEKKILYENFEYEISASIGVSRFPEDGTKISDLLTLADSAMYYAKRNNLGNHFLATDEFARHMARRQEIKQHLRVINYEKELGLRFQPRFKGKNKELIGVDAIIHWNHAKEGVIDRAEFLPVAEEMGVIQYITKWLFLSSLAQIKEWNEKYGRDLCININVSQSCIYHKIFFTNVSQMINSYGIQPDWLRISLNERSMMYAPEYMKKLLKELTELGINISIYDVGSGMISVGYIRQLFVDSLRVAPVIVHGCEDDDDKRKTLRGIIMLAKGMELKVAANEIENQQQYEILKELGCDVLQGNYFEKALDAQQFEQKYLAK